MAKARVEGIREFIHDTESVIVTLAYYFEPASQFYKQELMFETQPEWATLFNWVDIDINVKPSEDGVLDKGYWGRSGRG
jgi:hypothetical protein